MTRFLGKFKQSKSDEFFHDFDLYSAPCGNGESSTVGFQLPDIFQTIAPETSSNFAFKESPKKDFLVKRGQDTSEKRKHDVTKHLETIYKNKRMQVFHELARTRTALKSKEFFRIYLGSSNAIMNKRSQHALKLKTRFQKPKKPFSYQMEYEKLRGLRESEEELAKVQAYIDKMISRNIKKFEEEKKKQQLQTEKVEPHYPTLQELVTCAKHSYIIRFLFISLQLNKPLPKTPEPRKRKQPISNEQFLKRLKAKDHEQSKYLQALLPTHPDEQRMTTVQRFHENFQSASNLFTTSVLQRTLNLFDEISVNEIETYPSKYFKKIIMLVDDKNPMWKRAYKFIADEEKLWPEVKCEVMLMDFLFNTENKIRREVAVMIICLLLDLQEDYRFNVKRGFIRYILQSDVEKKRLQLELEPPVFPIVTIKAPVPWKCSIQVAKNRLEEVLMVNHPVLQAIQILWHNLYHDLLIVDTAKFYKDEIPYHAENITEIINSCCKITRDVSVFIVKVIFPLNFPLVTDFGQRLDASNCRSG